MDQGIYQNSSNSTSTSTIPTLTDTIDSDNPEQVQGVEQKEENIDQSEDQVKDDHEDNPDKATIYVPDLSSDTTKKILMTLFKTYGTIKQIHLKIKKKSKGKNAIIVFSNQHNARSTTLSMNLTMYRDQKSNIQMSKKKSFLASQDKSTVSPITKLCNMVQKMKEDKTDTNDQDSNDKKDQVTPIDIPEISNSTIKKSTKRKFKQKMNLHEDQVHFQASICKRFQTMIKQKRWYRSRQSLNYNVTDHFRRILVSWQSTYSSIGRNT